MLDCFIDFMNMAISSTKYFHKVVWQHMQDVVGSLIITFAKFPRESASEKKIKNRLRFDSYCLEFSVSLFIGTRYVSVNKLVALM